MMRIGWILLGIMPVLEDGRVQGDAAIQGDGQDSGVPTLYLFFGSEDPFSAELAQRAGKILRMRPGRVRLRPVLLVTRWRGLGTLSAESPLVRLIRELERMENGPVSLPLYDQDGLRRARAWRITRLPAAVVEIEGRAYAAFGSRIDVAGLLGGGR